MEGEKDNQSDGGDGKRESARRRSLAIHKINVIDGQLNHSSRPAIILVYGIGTTSSSSSPAMLDMNSLTVVKDNQCEPQAI